MILNIIYRTLLTTPDSEVVNTDLTFVRSIPPGDTEILDDYEFEFQDVDGNVLNTEIKPAMIGDTYIVGAGGSCPTEFSYNLNINGVFSQVVTVDINDDINININ